MPNMATLKCSGKGAFTQMKLHLLVNVCIIDLKILLKVFWSSLQTTLARVAVS